MTHGFECKSTLLNSLFCAQNDVFHYQNSIHINIELNNETFIYLHIIFFF